MSAPRPSPCGSCGALVYWARWEETGRWCPVDAEPTPGDAWGKGAGNLVLTLRGGELLISSFRMDVHGPTRNRYVSHFVTCPNADQHRKGRR
jgi:hypothetical protein